MKQKAIIIDLDGTYCENSHREHLWHQRPRPMDEIIAEVPNDSVVDWCQRIIDSHSEDHKIIFLTARTHDFRECTQKWLEKVAVGKDWELMLRNKDQGFEVMDDATFKGLTLLQHILPKYHVTLAVDDKLSCCQVFRAHGIPALHCNNSF